MTGYVFKNDFKMSFILFHFSSTVVHSLICCNKLEHS